MNVEFRQELNMSQKLILTAQMQQSLNILQMPIIELHETIVNELNENPLLEAVQENMIIEEPFEKFYRSLVDYGNYDKDNINYEETQNPMDYVQIEKTLKDHLIEQAGYLKEPSLMMQIIIYIIENIDSRGYFIQTPEELAKELSIEIENAEYAIKKVQEFHPDGVGAYDLKQCLLIQLGKRNIRDENIYKIINSCLELVAENKIKEIASRLNIKTSIAVECCTIIKTLEPKPSRGFYSGETFFITHEAYISKVGEEILITINDNILPNLRLTNYYKEIMKNATEEQTKEYIKTKLNSALYLIKGIEERKRTLYRILEEIVYLQKDYFLKGDKYLKQMAYKEIARSLNLHESTISRGIKDKYIQTPFKTVKIKDLFTTGFITINNNMSALVLKKEIKNVILNEDKSMPLSDQQICEILQEKGISISRRTVAKYRENLGILSSCKRKLFV